MVTWKCNHCHTWRETKTDMKIVTCNVCIVPMVHVNNKKIKEVNNGTGKN